MAATLATFLRRGGHPARAARTGAAARTAGFTLLELLVVVAIIAILASLLLPALANGRAQAKDIFCRANLHQIGCAAFNYPDDYNGWTLPSILRFRFNGVTDEVGWANFLADAGALAGNRLFLCPEVSAADAYVPRAYNAPGHAVIPRCAYVMNTIGTGAACWTGAPFPLDPRYCSGWGTDSENPVRFHEIKTPHDKIFIVDALRRPASLPDDHMEGWNSDLTGITYLAETDYGPLPTTVSNNQYRDVGDHHRGRFNLLAGDAHVERQGQPYSTPRRWAAREP